MRGGESGRLIIWGEKRYGEEMRKLYEGLTILQSRSREKARLQIEMLAGGFEEYCGKEFHETDAILAYFPRIGRNLEEFLGSNRRYTQKLYIVIGASYREQDERRLEEYYRLEAGRWFLMPYDRLYAGISARHEEIAGYIQRCRSPWGEPGGCGYVQAMKKMLADMRRICRPAG